jgi:steroid delta-isomerase-like uncharacterized protein
MRASQANSGVRLAELMAAMSIATDLGMGQPLESALSSCVVAMRLGEALRLDDDMLRDVYYQALLRYIGCNAETHALAAIFGDELALRHDFANAFPGSTFEIQDQVAQGDIVFNRITWRGVHNGEFAGVPATGRQIELKGINLFKVKSGRVVEQRAELDLLGLLQQIGAIPTA